jgi:hypothetical protein
VFVNSPFRGLGQDLTEEIFSAADPGTGLPIVFELGFALLVGVYLWSWAGGVSKAHSRAKRKPRRRISLRRKLARIDAATAV